MNYKNLLKIFVIVAIVMVGMGCVSAGLFGDGDALKGSGEYKVGDDIPAGEYYVKCDGYNLYVEVASDSSGDLDSIIYNLNTEGGTYITVNDGEYLKIQGGNLYELDKAPDRGAEDGYYKDGMYKVGEDIPAGEYQVESTEDLAYIEVSGDSRHQIDGIITNDNFEGNKYITIEDGQYLTLSNGAQIKA
ncbi:MAG: hypothetical protein IKH29_02520 [Methanobrevibacter sp.]|uniref:hypothetical protein n=1 Tax=Methanobrevibacter sp. TaxID=66852 RepID=UPI0025CF00AB|nr:hypothetical protein [Methanobrevibacter sp.]MBR3112572.1 hypothetical protein [Methanobrevibacter sp.]